MQTTQQVKPQSQQQLPPKFSKFLNKKVILKSNGFATYEGIVTEFKEGKTCLMRSTVIQKNNGFYPPLDVPRWFSDKAIVSITLA